MDIQKSVIQLDPHTYNLIKYEITSGDMNVCGTFDLPLVGPQKGILTEQLLEVAILYLESVNTGELENSYTTKAVEHIKRAQLQLHGRQVDRYRRKVNQTYKK